MKKIVLIAIGSFIILGLTNAQFFSYGIKGGVNYSKLKFDDIDHINGTAGTEYNLMQDEAFRSFHFGVMGRLKVFSLYLQPELYFNTSGGKVLIEEVQSGTVVKESIKDVKFSKIDLPVLLGFKIGPARLNAGPVASVVLVENNAIGDIIPELDQLSKNASIGYQAGIGIDILKFLTLDYRFEGSLSKFQDKLTVAGNEFNFDSRANMHLLSLGIMF